jgi:D-2-hydroxyacid dehydrogenase (NADP+)
MTNLLIMLTLPEKVRNRYYSQLKAKFPGINIDMVDHHSKVGPYIGSADILVTFGAHMSDHVLKEGANLKWVQALGTGVDGIVGEPSLRDGVLVTNMHGEIMADSMADAAFLSMLALSRNLPRALRNQSRRTWERFPSRLLNGKTVGIFGVGMIAADLAPKCKAFGMRVVGITSTKRELPGFDRMVGREELERTLPDLDYLILLIPYSAETRGIVGAKVLSAMKPSSFLINLARGGIVDEESLVNALKDGKIAGAALDVFATEPLPEDHPFWAMENVIVTPHLGGFHDEYAHRALPTVEENVRRFLAGDTRNMINVVRRPAGA